MEIVPVSALGRERSSTSQSCLTDVLVVRVMLLVTISKTTRTLYTGSEWARKHSRTESKMLKILLRRDVQGTIDYFINDKALSEDEKTGRWIGKGVAALGVGMVTNKSGISYARYPAQIDSKGRIVVTETELRAVLEGYAPPWAEIPGRDLVRRRVTKGRRCAWDCVLSCDKSISVAALCLPDAHVEHSYRVRAAYDAAVDEAFAMMESLARRTHGDGPDVETGSLLAARYDHEASRWTDPQLHSHLLIANATSTPSIDSYKPWHALETIQIYRHIREIDIVFQRALTWQLRMRGYNAGLKLVDNLPIAVLPAVDRVICDRLSRGHSAIQSRVAGRWEREKRDISRKRTENRFNEELRPAKKKALALRESTFARAISSKEAAQIAAELRQSLTTEPKSLDPLSEREVIRQILLAGRQLGCVVMTPNLLTRVALLASAQRIDVPFARYWTAARKHLGRTVAGYMSDQDLTDYVYAVDRYWQAEFEDTVLCARPRPVAVNRDAGLDNSHSRLRSTSGRSHRRQSLARGTALGSGGAGTDLGTSRDHQQQRPTEHDPLGTVASPYVLPHDGPERSGLSL